MSDDRIMAGTDRFKFWLEDRIVSSKSDIAALKMGSYTEEQYYSQAAVLAAYEQAMEAFCRFVERKTEKD